MKYFFILFTIFYFGVDVCAQKAKDFDILIEIKSTSLKDQQGSGTCWSFATTSFIETEAMRLGHDSISLSPVFYVTPAYLGKAEKFIETKGESWFDAGDLTFSVLAGYKKYGAIPNEIYDGIIEGDWRHDQVEMDNLLYEMVKSIGTSGYGRIKPHSWRKSIKAVLEAYIGKAPITFEFRGKEYTSRTFADTFIGINPDDYLEITSYTHYPFYKQCELKIPANWMQGKYLNLPIDEFENTINNALKYGYSLAWDGDASEPEFGFKSGVLKLPKEQEDGVISQQLRQSTFEDGTTTDDHNMHIIGMATDEDGKLYYLLKNSEGANDQGGYIFMSKNALLLKTISILVHKNAIPTKIREKTYLHP